MKKIWYVILGGIVMFVLFACSYDEMKLIGRWESSDGRHYIELNRDGTAIYEWATAWSIDQETYETERVTEYEDGIYLVDDNTLNFFSENYNDGEIIKWYYSLYGDELVLTDYDDGDMETFEKVY